MSDIVLMYPYTYKHARDAMLFHPLGVAQLSALLRQEGLDTLVKDFTFLHDDDEVMNELVEARPDVVGIYVMLTMVKKAHRLARKIRKLLPDALLVCGGPMPTLRPEQFSPVFDLVFRGEAINSLPRFCKDYREADTLMDVLAHYQLYPGIFFQNRADGTILQAPPESNTEEGFNAQPIPDRSDYDHARYQQFWQEREGFSPAGIMTSYGCPYNCEFCSKPVFGSYFRRRCMDRIMEEIHDIKSLGYTCLWIADDCFTLDLDHVRAFCNRLLQQDLRMRWTCLSRTDLIPIEDIRLMCKSGCKKVFFGLESGSNFVLKLMGKNTRVENAERTLHLFAQCGIETAGFFIIGYPGETYETIETTLAWALTLPLNEISFTTPFPLPGTRLFQRVTGMHPDADWSYENENRMIYQSEFDDDYLHKRIEETYEQFADRHR